MARKDGRFGVQAASGERVLERRRFRGWKDAVRFADRQLESGREVLLSLDLPGAQESRLDGGIPCDDRR
jgi:hypothetical protein